MIRRQCSTDIFYRVQGKDKGKEGSNENKRNHLASYSRTIPSSLQSRYRTPQRRRKQKQQMRRANYKYKCYVRMLSGQGSAQNRNTAVTDVGNREIQLLSNKNSKKKTKYHCQDIIQVGLVPEEIKTCMFNFLKSRSHPLTLTSGQLTESFSESQKKSKFLSKNIHSPHQGSCTLSPTPPVHLLFSSSLNLARNPQDGL